MPILTLRQVLYVVVGCVVTAAVAVGIYFGVKKSKKKRTGFIKNATQRNNPSVVVQEHGILTIRGDPVNLVEGQRITLVYDGDWTGKPVTYSYTTALALNKIIGTTQNNTIEWVVKPDLFGPITFSVSQGSSGPPVKSNTIQVVPTWSVTGPGDSTNSTVFKDVACTFKIVTQDILTASAAKFELLYGDAVQSNVTWDKQSLTLSWIPGTLSSTASAVKVRSTALKSSSYPNEISYTMPNPVTVISVPAGANGTNIANFLVTKTNGYIGSFHPGEEVKLSWVPSANIAAVNVDWRALDSDPWTSLITNLNGGNNNAMVTLPNTQATSIRLKISDAANSQTNAVSDALAMDIGGSWTFGPPTATTFSVMSPANEWQLCVPIQIDGTNFITMLEWFDTTNWFMTLSLGPTLQKDKWDLTSEYGALSVLNDLSALIFTNNKTTVPCVASMPEGSDLQVYVWVHHGASESPVMFNTPMTLSKRPQSKNARLEKLEYSANGLTTTAFPKTLNSQQQVTLKITGFELPGLTLNVFTSDGMQLNPQPILPTSDEYFASVTLPKMYAMNMSLKVLASGLSTALVSPAFDLVPRLSFKESVSFWTNQLAYDTPNTLAVCGDTWVLTSPEYKVARLELSQDNGSTWTAADGPIQITSSGVCTWSPAVGLFQDPAFILRLVVSFRTLGDIASTPSIGVYQVTHLPREPDLVLFSDVPGNNYISDQVIDGQTVIAYYPGCSITLSSRTNALNYGDYDAYLYTYNAGSDGTSYYQSQPVPVTLSASNSVSITLPEDLPQAASYLRFGLKSKTSETLYVSDPFIIGPALWINVDDTWNENDTDSLYHVKYQIHCPDMSISTSDLTIIVMSDDKNSTSHTILPMTEQQGVPAESDADRDAIPTVDPLFAGFTMYTSHLLDQSLITGKIYFTHGDSTVMGKLGPFKSYTASHKVSLTLSTSKFPGRSVTSKAHAPIREWRMSTAWDSDPEAKARWNVVRNYLDSLDSSDNSKVIQATLGPYVNSPWIRSNSIYGQVVPSDAEYDYAKYIGVLDGKMVTGSNTHSSLNQSVMHVDLDPNKNGGYTGIMWSNVADAFPGSAARSFVKFYKNTNTLVTTEYYWNVPADSPMGVNRAKYGDFFVYEGKYVASEWPSRHLKGFVDPDLPNPDKPSDKGPLDRLYTQAAWTHNYVFSMAYNVKPSTSQFAFFNSSGPVTSSSWGTFVDSPAPPQVLTTCLLEEIGGSLAVTQLSDRTDAGGLAIMNTVDKGRAITYDKDRGLIYNPSTGHYLIQGIGNDSGCTQCCTTVTSMFKKSTQESNGAQAFATNVYWGPAPTVVNIDTPDEVFVPYQWNLTPDYGFLESRSKPGWHVYRLDKFTYGDYKNPLMLVDSKVATDLVFEVVEYPEPAEYLLSAITFRMRPVV